MQFRVLYKRCAAFFEKKFFCPFWPKTSNFWPFSHKLAFLKGHISKNFENFKNPRTTFLKTPLKIVCTNFQLCNLCSILKTWINVKNSIEKGYFLLYRIFPIFRKPHLLCITITLRQIMISTFYKKALKAEMLNFNYV